MSTPPHRPGRTGVLFVCLGNICRSPLAEAIFLHLARGRGVDHLFDVDSCGTGHWHVGEPADRRSIAIARRYGVEVTSIARQLDCVRDAERFRHIIAMDRANRRDIIRAGAPPERVHLLRAFEPGNEAARENPDAAGDALDIPDPYSWPGDGFDRVYTMIERGCTGLLEHLLEGLRQHE